MKAIQIAQFGGPDVMSYLEVDMPVPNSSQTLIEVSAAGINYADTHQTENSYLSPQKLPMIPGLEVVGKSADGRRVLAPVEGAYAQYAVAATDSLMDIPDGISDGEALAMMVQGSTAYHLLKTMAHVQEGESVVIHAAAGGVGVIAIQLAKLWGATVIAVVSPSGGKAELVKTLGADAVVSADESDLAAAIRAANGGKGVDIILEMVGGKTFDDSLGVLANFGRLVTFGNASRSATRTIGGGELMNGSKTFAGFWLANCFGDRALLQDVILELFGLITLGQLKPVVGEIYPLSQAAQAHRDLLARKTTGKLVLDPTR